MEVCRRVMRYRTGDVFNLYDFGDIHGGTVHCAEDKAEKTFKEIVKDPFALWWDKGDSAECITPTDKRWQFAIRADWLQGKQNNIGETSKKWYIHLAQKAVDARLPHQDDTRCLGKVEGTHEIGLRLRNHYDIQANICGDLGIENMGFSCFYHLVFQRVNSTEKHMFKFHVTHGSGNAQTPGGRMQKLRKIMNQTTVLYTSVAHMHDIVICTPPVLDTGNDLKIRSRNQIGVVSGSFLRTYTQNVEAGYGEMRNYDPVSLGYAKWEIRPDEELITATPRYV